MKTCLDCIPCFVKQSLEMARMVFDNERHQKQFVDQIAQLIPSFSLNSTPPEMGRMINQKVAELIGPKDVYKEVKDKSNAMAMAIYPKHKEMVTQAEDPLLMAGEIAIAGNVIDYAAKNTFDIEAEVAKLFRSEFREINKTRFDYPQFKKALLKAKTILYVADNAGEIMFDRVLMEEIPGSVAITCAVRDKAVLNDALIEDAKTCGIDQRAKIISSGSDAPGTLLNLCSKEFLDLFHSADMVISKGQGTYEALDRAKRDIFFLFRAKCPVIAQHAQVRLGDLVLIGNDQSQISNVK